MTTDSKKQETPTEAKLPVMGSHLYEYKAEVCWSFPYVGASIITIKGTDKENAINSFYKQTSGGELMHVYDCP
nr:hypothetical protein [uncultured Flavobacterium sp.]